MATQQWTMQVIEALNTLWITLPLRGVTDERGTLESYGFALEGNSVEAIRNTVNMLRRGEIADASKEWCPKAPKLAEYVRAEQSRLDAVNRPKMVSYQPVSRPWKDWNIIQRERTHELSEQGFVLLDKDVPHEIASNRMRQKKYPVGSIWFWCLQEVWGPRHV
ncbi:hypothetical protein [Agrobacterium leguminum]